MNDDFPSHTINLEMEEYDLSLKTNNKKIYDLIRQVCEFINNTQRFDEIKTKNDYYKREIKRQEGCLSRLLKEKKCEDCVYFQETCQVTGDIICGLWGTVFNTCYDYTEENKDG